MLNNLSRVSQFINGRFWSYRVKHNIKKTIKNKIKKKSAEKNKQEKRYLEEVLLSADDLNFLLERKHNWSYTSSHLIKENLRSVFQEAVLCEH